MTQPVPIFLMKRFIAQKLKGLPISRVFRLRGTKALIPFDHICQSLLIK